MCTYQEASYAAASIIESVSDGLLIFTFMSQPSAKEDSLTMPGVSFKFSFTSMTSPEIGEYTSEAALTDSTTPKDDFASTLEPTSGSSTYTMSPNSACRRMRCANASVYECASIYCPVRRVRATSRARARVFVRPSSPRSRPPSSSHLRVIGDADRRDITFDLGPFVRRHVLQTFNHCSRDARGALVSHRVHGPVSSPRLGARRARGPSKHSIHTASRPWRRFARASALVRLARRHRCHERRVRPSSRFTRAPERSIARRMTFGRPRAGHRITSSSSHRWSTRARRPRSRTWARTRWFASSISRAPIAPTSRKVRSSTCADDARDDATDDRARRRVAGVCFYTQMKTSHTGLNGRRMRHRSVVAKSDRATDRAPKDDAHRTTRTAKLRNRDDDDDGDAGGISTRAGDGDREDAASTRRDARVDRSRCRPRAARRSRARRTRFDAPRGRSRARARRRARARTRTRR